MSPEINQKSSSQLTAWAIIPARYASTRFPGKVLAPIEGKPMLWHVYQRAQEAEIFEHIVVATDDERVASEMRVLGLPVEMTVETHQSGTDRVWEVASRHPQCDVVFNIQADEPFLPAAYLKQLYDSLQNDTRQRFDVMTLLCPLSSLAQWQDPNVVKALPANDGCVQLFSRAALPFDRDQTVKGIHSLKGLVYRHIGVYAYRYEALRQFVELSPHPVERMEKLEQLRGLAHGLCYGACMVEKAPVGVDRPEDLSVLLAEISNR